MTLTCLRLLRVAAWIAVACLLCAARPGLAGELEWSKIHISDGFDISCPVTHSRTTTGPERIDRTSMGFKRGSRGRLPVDQVGIRNDTDCIARKVWLYWRLYRETDLSKPAFESLDIPTELSNVAKDISPSVQVKWVFPSDQDGALLTEDGVTYRIEYGVGKVEWSDGTVWRLGQGISCVPGTQHN